MIFIATSQDVFLVVTYVAVLFLALRQQFGLSAQHTQLLSMSKQVCSICTRLCAQMVDLDYDFQVNLNRRHKVENKVRELEAAAISQEKQHAALQKQFSALQVGSTYGGATMSCFNNTPPLWAKHTWASLFSQILLHRS